MVNLKTRKETLIKIVVVEGRAMEIGVTIATVIVTEVVVTGIEGIVTGIEGIVIGIGGIVTGIEGIVEEIVAGAETVTGVVIVDVVDVMIAVVAEIVMSHVIGMMTELANVMRRLKVTKYREVK